MWSCTICDTQFSTRGERDRHKKRDCTVSITLKKNDGSTEAFERVNGKFICSCGTSRERADHFRSHWRECQIKG
jgi:hypothetical protein